MNNKEINEAKKHKIKVIVIIFIILTAFNFSIYKADEKGVFDEPETAMSIKTAEKDFKAKDEEKIKKVKIGEKVEFNGIEIKASKSEDKIIYEIKNKRPEKKKFKNGFVPYSDQFKVYDMEYKNMAVFNDDDELEYSNDSEEYIVDSGETEKVEVSYDSEKTVTKVSFVMNGYDDNIEWIIVSDEEVQKIKAEEAAEREKEAAENSHYNETWREAREELASYFPYPATVKFSWFSSRLNERTENAYEEGTIKYKNDYGQKVKSEYRMWYNAETGELNGFELDGRVIK